MQDPRFLLETSPRQNLHARFAQDVLRGLSAAPKRIPSVYFYDSIGSELFEKICTLPEYYITRTEKAILETHIHDIARFQNGSDLSLVEFGSGSSYKTRLLIQAFLQQQGHLTYRPIDISDSILREGARRLLNDFPALRVHALAAEYDDGIRKIQQANVSPKILVFLGSNIGNFEPPQAVDFLNKMRHIMQPRDLLLLGTDMVKPRHILEPAYDDAQQVTAQFNLNLLRRINRELGGDFDLSRFRHRAFFNETESRIEMHIESIGQQQAHIAALDRTFAFRAGETIHTENSYKFTPDMLQSIFAAAGLKRLQHWQDADGYFRLNLLGPA
ncbi:MAG: L-histidine N(alpha)-methyltransferase [candidate division KSB1 bacterium]|nr:L-histidine N(alpha)-methyltransferase [candidate division KSB1 bacterium]